MDVKEIAEIAAVPAIHPPTSESDPTVAQETVVKSDGQEGAIAALRPVLKIDTDGLVLLQFQDDQSGDVIFQVPSEEATRQYRQRDNQPGTTGQEQTDQVAAVVSSSAAAATTVPPPPVPPTAPQPTSNVVSAQAVKPVESSDKSSTNSVRVNA